MDTTVEYFKVNDRVMPTDGERVTGTVSGVCRENGVLRVYVEWDDHLGRIDRQYAHNLQHE